MKQDRADIAFITCSSTWKIMILVTHRYFGAAGLWIMRETCDSARVHDLIAVGTASESRRRSTKSSSGMTALLDDGRVPRSGNIRS
jgi:hypothetical protein